MPNDHAVHDMWTDNKFRRSLRRTAPLMSPRVYQIHCPRVRTCGFPASVFFWVPWDSRFFLSPLNRVLSCEAFGGETERLLHSWIPEEQVWKLSELMNFCQGKKTVRSLACTTADFLKIPPWFSNHFWKFWVSLVQIVPKHGVFQNILLLDFPMPNAA